MLLDGRESDNKICCDRIDTCFASWAAQILVWRLALFWITEALHMMKIS